MASSAWPALLGVILGFALSEGSRWVQRVYRIREARRTVRVELRAILAQIPQKDDILRQAIESMKTSQILPTRSVHILSHGYMSVLEHLYPHLSDNERTSLHVIYERLRVLDEFMDTLEEDVTNAVRDSSVADPWIPFINKAQEMRESLEVVRYLAEQYLRGEAVDVFGIEAQSEQAAEPDACTSRRLAPRSAE